MSRAKFSEVAVDLLAIFGKVVVYGGAMVAIPVLLCAAAVGLFTFHAFFPVAFWFCVFFAVLFLTIFLAVRLAVSGRRSQ